MPRRRLLGFAAAAALIAAACFTDATGPRLVPRAALAVLPTWANPLSAGAPVATVHIVARRSDGSVAKDTTLTYPTGADSLVVNLNVTLGSGAVSGSEPFAVRFDLLGAAGDTLFQGGPVTLTGYGTGKAPTGQGVVTVPVTYTGPGKNAATVQALVPDTSVLFGDSVTLTAIARDAQGAPLPGTLVAWTSTDTTKVKVRTKFGGRLIGGSARGVVKVAASTLTGQSDTVRVTVQPVASQLALASGNAQSAAAGSKLPLPLKVAVTAADAGPVRGVAVAWSITSAGGGTLSAATTFTDSLGIAADTLTLPAAAGPVTVRAAVGTITGSPVTFTATALPTTPTKLAFTVNPPATTPAGAAIAPVITVAEQDGAGNTVPSAQDSIVIALGANPAGGTLGGTLRVKAVNGVATFSTLSLNKAGAGYALVASAPGTSLTGATSTSFAVTAGAPTSLLVLQDPTNAAALAAITPVVSIAVVDALGNTVSGATNAVTVAIQTGSGTAGAVLGGTTTVNAVNGIATFPGLTVNKVGVSYRLTATAAGLGSTLTAPFNIGPGTVASVAYGVAPPATATSLTGFSATVQLLDAGGNLVTTATDTVTLTLGTSPGGATITGTAKAAAVAGVATFTGILLDRAGNYTLVATRTGTPPVTSGIISLLPGAAAALTYQVTPSATGSAGVALATQPVVQVVDAAGNVVTSASGTMTAASLPAATALIGGSAPIVNGVATFSGFAVGATVGSKQLTFTDGTLTSAASTLVLAAGPASQVLPDSGAAQAAIAGGAVPTTLVARVFDAWTNPVPGATVTFAVTAGGGSLGTPSSASDVNGRARTGWTLGGSVGTNTATATVAGVGAPATFSGIGAPVGTTATWLGNTSTTWTTAANWSPAAVPTSASNVFVPSGTIFAPSLGGNQAVSALTVMPGVPVNLGTFTLTVGGSLDAGSAMTGSGVVVVSGGAGTVQGTGIPNLTVATGRTLAGRTSVTGITQVTGGNLVLGGNRLDVGGAFSTTSTGALVMNNAADSLVVAGTVTFGGASETGFLTAGRIIARGASFTQLATFSATSFAGSGSHVVQFEPAGTVTVALGAPTSASFGGLTAATGTVAFSSGAIITGNVDILPAATAIIASTATDTIAVGGDITDASGTAKWQAATTKLTKSGVTTLPTLMWTAASTVVVDNPGSMQLGSNAHVAGSVLTRAGRFEVLGTTVIVDGAFTVNGTGALRMTTAGGDLTIGGAASFGGGSTAGLLTTGTVRLLGNFTQLSTGTLAYNPSAGHTTVFQGAAPQAIAFQSPGSSTFGGLTINNASGVSASTAFTALGTIAVQAGTFTTSGTVTAAGSITDAGAPLSPLFAPSALTLTGATTVTLPPRLTAPTIINSAGALATTGPVHWTGNLTISGGTFDVGANVDSVDGNLATTGSGALRMVTAGGDLTVGGAATFGGGSTSGILGAGTLRLLGNLVQSAGTGAGSEFAPSGTHSTVFQGTAAQGVTIASTTTSRPNLVVVNKSAGTLTLNTNVTFLGTTTVTAGTVAGTSGTIAGSLLDAGAPATPLWTVTNTTFTGVGAVTLPARLAGAVTFSSAGSLTPSAAVTFSGAVTVSAGTLVVGAFTDSLAGTLTVSGTGAIGTTVAASDLVVVGNASFAGTGSTAPTVGSFRFKGNFTQTGAGAVYAPGGTHVTRLEGTALQSVSFGDPVNSGFNDLVIRNGAAPTAVSFANAARARNVTDSIGVAQGISGAFTIAGTLVDSASSRATPGALWTVASTTFTGTGTRPFPRLLATNVTVNTAGILTLGNNVRFGGQLNITGGQLDVAATTDTVISNFTTSGTGGLLMGSAAADLRLAGTASFGGTGTVLNGGTLRLASTFTQTGTTTFSSSGTHLTRFEGATLQQVTFAAPASNPFNFVTFAGTGGANFNSNVVVNGTDSTLAASGNVTSAAGDTLFLANAGGVALVDPSVKSQPVATVLSGAASPSIPAAMRGEVIVAAARSLAANLTVTGQLTINAPLTVAGRTVVVGGTPGALLVQGASTGLIMTNATDSVDVVSATFQGSDQTGNLTNGKLVVRGNFVQNSLVSPRSFAAFGIHTTSFVTTGTNTITFQNSDSTTSRFNAVEFRGPGQMTLQSPVYAGSAVTTIAGSGANVVGGANGSLYSFGTLSVAAGTTLGSSGAKLRLLGFAGNASVSGTATADTALVYGAGRSILVPAALTRTYLVISTSAAQSSLSTCALTDTVIVSGAGSVLNRGACAPFSMQGLKVLNGGVLAMTGAADSIIVVGDALFNGGSSAGFLTAGSLVVRGNFTQLATGSGASFQASGSHKTHLSPTAGKPLVSFATPGLGTAASRFQNLYVPTSAGVVDTLGTQVFVADTLNYGRTIAAGRGLAITSSQPLVVGVIFDTTSGGGVLRGAAGATLRVRNRFNGIPATYAIDTTVVDTTSGAVNVPTFLPASTALKHVVVEGFARGNSGQTISGDLEVRASGRFRVDTATTFTVTGSLRTAQSGTLGMNSTGGLVTLTVNGNATFAGGSTSGILVSGNLIVAGSFTQGGAATAFAPNSGHSTTLTGDNTKTITFANPDTLFNGLASSFAMVTMSNNSFLPNLASDIAARDSVIMPPITGRNMASSGGLRAIYTRGMAMFNTTFTDIRLLLNRNSTGASGRLGSLSWQGSSYGTLPIFEVNGAIASLPTITPLSLLNFSAAGGTGCFVRVSNTFLMTVNLTGSNPTGANARKTGCTSGVNAILTWP